MMGRLGLTLAVLLWAAGAPFAAAQEHESTAHEVAVELEPDAPAAHELSFDGLMHNKEFWGTLVNFGVLILLLTWVIRKKGNPALAERRAEVERELEEAKRLRLEAEAKQQEAADRLAKLDDEMAQIRADMTKAGEAERDRMVQQAEEKAARVRRDTTFLIEQQIKQLRHELTEQAAKAAVDAAHGLLAQQTTDADQRDLADAYLKRLDEVAKEQSS